MKPRNAVTSRDVAASRAASIPNEAVGRIVAAAVEAELGREKLRALVARAGDPSSTRVEQRSAVTALVATLFNRLPDGGAGPFLAAFLGAVVGQALEVLAAPSEGHLSSRRVKKLINIGAARASSPKGRSLPGRRRGSVRRTLSPAQG
jgi:hypothetical protein